MVRAASQDEVSILLRCVYHSISSTHHNEKQCQSIRWARSIPSGHVIHKHSKDYEVSEPRSQLIVRYTCGTRWYTVNCLAFEFSRCSIWSISAGAGTFAHPPERSSSQQRPSDKIKTVKIVKSVPPGPAAFSNFRPWFFPTIMPAGPRPLPSESQSHSLAPGRPPRRAGSGRSAARSRLALPA